MNTVLAIAAHPDDIEFLMSGTLLRLREAGWSLHYINVADGCCGTTQYDAETIAAIRREEARAAAAALGAEFHDSLCHDLEVFYERRTLLRLASIVREVAPRIVLTHALADYMEDHMNTARLAVTAAFSRGMRNFPVEPPRPPVLDPVTVYHAQPYMNRDPLGELVRAGMYIDVAELVERKCELLAHHVSQKRWLDESQGHDSYLDTLRRLDAEVGALSGVYSHAEGWRRHWHAGFCGPADDPLHEALAPWATLAS